MVKQQTQKELVDELTNKMNESIKNYKNDPSEELKFLDFISRFNNYSVRNISLIQNQFGNAVGVASYKQHKENGYQVQKGEKAIRILAPKFQKMFQDDDRQWKFLSQATANQKAKIKTGELKTEERLAGFLSVPVFDITQTDCPEQDYPKLYPNKPESFTFNGTKKDIETLRSVLIDYAEEKNVAVSFDKTNSTAKGYFEPATNRIVIKDRMDEVEQIKVLLHELAHAEMHNVHKLATKTPEQLRSSVLEYQAEMTAYVVSSTLGIDSEDYSKKYLANWTKRKVDDDVYIQSLEEVKNVSNDFMNDISDRFNKLEKTLILDETEFKNLIQFQLSHYELVEEFSSTEIVYTPDIESANLKETYSSYQALWENQFENNLTNDLECFTLKKLQKDEFLSKSPDLLNKLANYNSNVNTTLEGLKKEAKLVKELDLDNDGVPDRIDPDDTRSVIRTEADKDLVGNKTDKVYEQERKRTPTRTRGR